jgi:hypothetical protein
MTLSSSAFKGSKSALFLGETITLNAFPLIKAFGSIVVPMRADIKVDSIHFFGAQRKFPTVFGGTISGPTTGTVE